MKILHISNGFAQSELYKNLFFEIDKLGIDQVIYSAVRTSEEAMYKPEELEHLQICTNNILSISDRIFFRFKINKILKNLISHVSIKNINLIHAHTLYSDGAVAFNSKKLYGIPYIVSVRNTDLNIFQKYRIDLRPYRNNILKEAERVFFISPSYKEKLLDILPVDLKLRVEEKSAVIPNGIDDDFFSDVSIYSDSKKTNSNNILKLIYVGDFRSLKNVPNLIKAIEILESKISVRLTIVGGGGEDENRVKTIVRSKKLSQIICFTGRVTDNAKLKKIYSDHDIFIMVSKPETFGLVYIEALSQGIPIIYTEGEGVDGYFDSLKVGAKVSDVNNPQEIAEVILSLHKRITFEMKQTCMDLAKEFDWESISKKYFQYYKEIT